ncbi:hypothetical protein M4I21_04385 [Cellulophaga sp. 20_2_10]|uniref:hypothetical protein n=1 Tax=Cellulophaga sp. 20_2_10 TaxID=2942476 RepID=UPI00201A8B0E|nr:hypothetical protein [Cellulophaga sp. 20_2_10]MCL5245032.1 hypothetical protein [Cellulophaga sp. 20_2_10]
MHIKHILKKQRDRYLLVVSVMLFSITSLSAQKITTSIDSILFESSYLKITTKKATVMGTVLYHTKTDSINFFIKNRQDSSECKPFYSPYYNPLSLVGPFYSYEYGVSSQEACGPLGNSLGVVTLDLRTMQNVTLQEVFTEESLLNALRNDSWIKELAQLNNVTISEIKTYKAFLHFLSEAASMQFLTHSFTVLDYTSVTNEAQVRFVAQEYMGYDHNKHFQLGLTLQPREDLKEVFKSHIDFKLGAYKNGLIK